MNPLEVITDISALQQRELFHHGHLTLVPIMVQSDDS
jgi:hypothetical protein